MRKKRKMVGILCLLSVLFLNLPVSVYAAQGTDYYINDDEKRMVIPKAYMVSRVMLNFDNEYLNAPNDLFIDTDNTLYIADTGNNRVLKCDATGNVLHIFGTEEGKSALSAPQGVYVSYGGHVFVADTGNGRVVHFSKDGDFIEEFTQPKDPTYDTSVYAFTPTKVMVDAQGAINILSDKDYHGIIKLDPEGNFLGYVGTNKVKTTLWERMLRFVLTEEQQLQLGKTEPPYFSGMATDADGLIYTATANSDTDQIKRLNASGQNIYETGKSYTEKLFISKSGEDAGSVSYGMLSDITVDQYGIVSVVDSLNRMVYQYDPDGNMLCCFGGRGETKGKFENPIAISVGPDNNLYVLDKDRGSIQVFTSTAFIQYVHSAIQLFDQGKYEDAMVDIQKVLSMNETYVLVYKQMGKYYYKTGDYENSMKCYRKARDYEGHSEVFSDYRQQIYAKYFLWFVAGVILLLALIILACKKINRYAKKISLEGIRHGNH